MFVDFVNLFSDPEGFFKTSSLWLVFLIPYACSGFITMLMSWYFGHCYKTSEGGITASNYGAFWGGWAIIALLSLIVWGDVTVKTFTAHGVHEGLPMYISVFLWIIVMGTAVVLSGFVGILISGAKPIEE